MASQAQLDKQKEVSDIMSSIVKSLAKIYTGSLEKEDVFSLDRPTQSHIIFETLVRFSASVIHSITASSTASKDEILNLYMEILKEHLNVIENMFSDK